MSGLIGVAIDLLESRKLVDDSDAKGISLSDYSQAAFGVDPSDNSEGCQGTKSREVCSLLPFNAPCIGCGNCKK